MHRHGTGVAQSSFRPFGCVLHAVGYFAHRLLHVVHADKLVQILQYIFQRALLGHISLNILLLNQRACSSSADKGGENVFSLFHSFVRIAVAFVLCLQLILEVSLQSALGLDGEVRQPVLVLQGFLAYFAELLIPRRGQPEDVLEPA